MINFNLFAENGSLTNRQTLLQDSENRLLFMTTNENMCDTWICLINYLRLCLLKEKAIREKNQDQISDLK